MNDSKRLLLQAFMSHKVLHENEAIKIFQTITNNDGSDMAEFIAVINTELNPLFMEIRKVVFEENGEPYWGLVNSRNEEHSKLASEFTQAELTYFKQIIEYLFKNSEEGVISNIKAINLHLQLEIDKFGPTVAENAINKLIKERWLVKSGNNGISLGVRSFLELRPYFEQMYPDDVVDCVMCSELVIKGESCSDERCSTRMHYHCAKRWFTDNKKRTCPTCTQDWPEVN